MMEYQKNKEQYKPITLRVKRNDAEVLEWINQQESVNASILRLISDEVERLRQEPIPERLKQFEVMEQNDECTHHVIASFDAMEDAVRCLIDYVQAFTPAGRVYIAERFTGILPNGRKIKTAKIIKAFSRIEKEEN